MTILSLSTRASIRAIGAPSLQGMGPRCLYHAWPETWTLSKRGISSATKNWALSTSIFHKRCEPSVPQPLKNPVQIRKTCTFFSYLIQHPVTQSLKADQTDCLVKKIAPFSRLKTTEFVEQLNSPKGINRIVTDIERHDSYPIIALAALCRGQISQNQFATSCLLYSAIDQLIKTPYTMPKPQEKTTIPAFEGPLACDIFDIELKFFPKKALQIAFSLSESQYSKFKLAMENAPKSEHFFS